MQCSYRSKTPSAHRRAPRLPAAQHFLVVDDNRDSADSLAMLLSSQGGVVRTAYDGADALKLVATLRPDVVLLDIAMPTLNGYEVARRMRSLPGGANCLLIALTGFGQAADKRRSEAGGFDGHLVKPVDFDALTKMVAELRSEQRVS